MTFPKCTTLFSRTFFTLKCDIDIMYTCLNIQVHNKFDLSALKTTLYLQENCLHIFNIFNKPVFNSRT